MEYQNGIMEDLGSIIGYQAANRLIAVFGGASLYVPNQLSDEHTITHVVGRPAAVRLAEAFGGTTLANLPDNEEFYRLRRVRQVAGLLRAGVGARDVADLVGVSTKQVGRYRAEAETIGLLPMIFEDAA